MSSEEGDECQKRWVPSHLSQPFLKLHFIAIPESEMGGEKNTVKSGKVNTRGRDRKIFCLPSNLPLSGLHASCIV